MARRANSLNPDPPTDLPPEQLFRLLVSKTALPIDYRIRGAEQVPLEAKALRSSEYWSATDLARSAPDGRQDQTFCAALISAALHSAGQQIFVSADDAGALQEWELYALYRSLLPALSGISPMYGVSNQTLWHDRLRLGAQHGSNYHDAYLLGMCVDEGYRQVYPRPDRFFDCAPNQLTDGQTMAFWAARTVLMERQKHD